jgi:hypothetical protein
MDNPDQGWLARLRETDVCLVSLAFICWATFLGAETSVAQYGPVSSDAGRDRTLGAKRLADADRPCGAAHRAEI